MKFKNYKKPANSYIIIGCNDELIAEEGNNYNNLLAKYGEREVVRTQADGVFDFGDSVQDVILVHLAEEDEHEKI